MPDTVTGTAAEQPADDIRSTLAAALADSEKTQDAPDAAPETPAPKEDAAPEADTETAATETKPDEEKPDAEAAPKAAEPPANWSAADKEMFKKAPPDAQAYLLRRDKEMTADYTRKTQEIAYLKKEYEPIDRLFDPFKGQLQQTGHTPRSLIEGWFNVERALNENRGVDVIKGAVQAYKIDPRAVAAALGLTAPPAPQNGADPNPVPVALPPEITAKLSRYDQFIDQQQRQQQEAVRQAQAAEVNRVTTDIEQFQKAADAQGNLLHPHFADVEQDMAALALIAKSRGVQPKLQDLYDQAVYANPSTRAKVLAAAEAAQQEKTRLQARAKAEAARKAGSSVTGAPGAGQAPKPNGSEMSLREQLMAAADDA